MVSAAIANRAEKWLHFDPTLTQCERLNLLEPDCRCAREVDPECRSRAEAARNTCRFERSRASFACTLDGGAQDLSKQHTQGRAAL
jgi:hypothetical protein